jgi:Cft2 family RNA processing exonuclease
MSTDPEAAVQTETEGERETVVQGAPAAEGDAATADSGVQNAPSGDADRVDAGPGFALLRVAVGDRLPEGSLGPETVPSAVLAIPIELAIEHLVQHAKGCKNPRCPHVPVPLQVYRRMRPDAIRTAPGARDQINKVLWTQGNHELVRWVRGRVLNRNTELAEEISSGTLLGGNRLNQVLDDIGEDGPLVLASLLWATEFKGKDADLLFRWLVALLGHERPATPEKPRVKEQEADPKIRAKYRDAVRDRERALQESKKLARDLELKDSALKKVRQDLLDAQGKSKRLTDEVGRLEGLLRDADLAHRNAKRDGDRASLTSDRLRRDLREQQKAIANLEAARAEFALQLATERRTVANLQLTLAAVPTGSDAVHSFLRDEGHRLEIARTIAAGGDRVRADQDWTSYRKWNHAFLDAYPRYRQPPPVKSRAKTASRFIALGGAAEVGRSCYLLELGKHRIMVDCGIKPSSDEDAHPDIGRIDSLDALILTHAHTDHIGWVPALVRRFPEIGIYCSEATAALLPVMLDDCYQHYLRKIHLQRERAKYIANAATVQEEYFAGNVNAVPSLVINCLFNKEEGLPFGDASLVFYPAGHILGAASVLLRDASGRRIFFSGDFASFPQLTVCAADWPDEIGEVDLLVLESTYGGREPHRPLEDSRDELVSFVKKTIEDEGSVILASFGLGRAQELLKLIVTSVNTGALPRVPVYVDGMIKRINPIYRKLASFDLSAEAVYEVTGDTDRQEVASAAQTRPSIIVTTSGMLTGGPVLHYARHLLPDARHRLVLTGYQDEGAPSRVLREVAAGRRIVTYHDERGDDVKFEAAMPAKEVGLSAHADQPGLLSYSSRLRPRQIALVHGEPHGQKVLRQHLLAIHPGSDVVCGPAELSLL